MIPPDCHHLMVKTCRVRHMPDLMDHAARLLSRRNDKLAAALLDAAKFLQDEISQVEGPVRKK